jgi:hypothetical protein
VSSVRGAAPRAPRAARARAAGRPQGERAADEPPRSSRVRPDRSHGATGESA